MKSIVEVSSATARAAHSRSGLRAMGQVPSIVVAGFGFVPIVLFVLLKLIAVVMPTIERAVPQ